MGDKGIANALGAGGKIAKDEKGRFTMPYVLGGIGNECTTICGCRI